MQNKTKGEMLMTSLYVSVYIIMGLGSGFFEASIIMGAQ